MATTSRNLPAVTSRGAGFVFYVMQKICRAMATSANLVNTLTTATNNDNNNNKTQQFLCGRVVNSVVKKINSVFSVF